MSSKEKTTKCLTTGLVGKTNAGKSTLINRIIGKKVAIVTPKVQTTRDRIIGIKMLEETQLVFVDTPGVFGKTEKFHDKNLLSLAWNNLTENDICLILVDVKKEIKSGGISKATENIVNKLDKKHRYVLVLNKIDIIEKEELLKLTVLLNNRFEFERTFMISALHGNGVDDLLHYLKKQAPISPFLYPEDEITDMPERLFAAEITREKLMLKLQKELPYSIKVETENWEEDENKININQVIYVQDNRHKKIVLGKAGRMIKEVGRMSRLELSKIFDIKINLFLFIKIGFDSSSS